MTRLTVATASALDCVRPTVAIMIWPPPVSGPASGLYGSSPFTWPVTPDAAKARTASSSRPSGTGCDWLSNARALPWSRLPSDTRRLRRVSIVSMRVASGARRSVVAPPPPDGRSRASMSLPSGVRVPGTAAGRPRRHDTPRPYDARHDARSGGQGGRASSSRVRPGRRAGSPRSGSSACCGPPGSCPAGRPGSRRRPASPRPACSSRTARATRPTRGSAGRRGR